jgi:hypothetical protein
MNKSMTLQQWIIKGEVGLSSKTMWAAIAGVEDTPQRLTGKYSIPYDPDDFHRCYEFVRLCRITKEQRDMVKIVFPAWSPFINNWDKLSSMYEENIKNDWKTHKQIGMYDFMKQLEHESRLIDGWSKNSSGWKRDRDVSFTIKNTNP